MRLVYYRGRTPNFGDDLNADIWPCLAPELFGHDEDVGFVGIGTIIGMPCGDLRRLHVFSSGVGNGSPAHWNSLDVEYCCVRGPISARILGLPADCAVTDGAVLTPLVSGYPREARGGGRTLVIPHWETLEHPGWKEAAALAGFQLLDPRGDPRKVVSQIAEARLVLTESLHGAILADTLGIPWQAFATSKNFGIAKWVDWTLSLGRQFKLTMVPPPGPEPVLAFGRPFAPYGRTVHCDAQIAMAQCHTRGRTPREPADLRARLKNAVKHSPLRRRLLGLDPTRTAEALDALARVEGTLTPPTMVQELQERMLTRLRSLVSSFAANV